MTKWVYGFAGGKADGTADMKSLLGGKGANLAEMCRLGLPVPPGFTVTTEVCTHFYDNDRHYPADLADEVKAAMAAIEKEVGASFGDPKNPLLVSVRSGARASMPGMMDTVLNLGLNDSTVAGMAQRTGDAPVQRNRPGQEVDHGEADDRDREERTQHQVHDGEFEARQDDPDDIQDQ